MHRELHQESVDEDGVVTLATDFVTPDDEIIATRVARFAGGELAPAFELENRRLSTVGGLRYDGGRAVLYRRRGDGAELEEKPVEGAGLMVADAGVDRLIATRWDELLAGAAVPFDLAVPERLRLMRFELSLIGSSRVGEEPTVVFRMVSLNPLIRLIMGEIRMTYHRDLHVMLRYEGPSNLESVDGGHPRVVVDLPLTDTRRQAATGRM